MYESAAKAFSLLLLRFVHFTVLNCFLTHMLKSYKMKKVYFRHYLQIM